MTSADPSVTALCTALSLSPHPEGGFYREHYRGARVGTHSVSTAIFYLLPADAFSGWHRVIHDELWHHYQGAPIELHTLDEEHGHRVHLLGSVRPGSDAQPCVVVPAHVWQAARPVGGWALMGNTVAPGFEFTDWVLLDAATRARLEAQHPGAVAALRRFSR